MSDLNHFYGGDLLLSNTGDLAAISGTTQGIQRVLRQEEKPHIFVESAPYCTND